MLDPWLSYFGHPLLPAGYNADDHDGDDVNGAGTNWPVWPQLFDTFVAFEVLVVTDEMLEIFETGCPDYITPHVDSNVEFPREHRVYLIDEEGPRTIRIAAVSDTIVFPREHRAYVSRKEAGSIQVAGVSDAVTLPRETRQQTMRRRA